YGAMTDKYPNMLLVGGNQQTAMAVNAVHLLDEQAKHVAYIIRETRARGAQTVEAKPEDIDAFVEGIFNSPNNKAQLEFFKECTPGYYNGEGKATRTDELFLGGRYGDGPMAFFELLQSWRKDGAMKGVELR
ncbi:MAG: monooxygenase, partial [Hyphomonadaceae bacterium]